MKTSGSTDISQDNPEALAALESMVPLAEIGKAKGKADNVSLPVHGNSSSYLIRRLQRDAPTIAAQLAKGEFKSPRLLGSFAAASTTARALR